MQQCAAVCSVQCALQCAAVQFSDQVREVRSSRLVGDELEHGLVLHLVDVERQGSHGDPGGEESGE